MTEDSQSSQQWFTHHLRKGLNALYDPAALRQCKLIEVLGLSDRHDPAFQFRQILLDGIEALKPAENTPAESKMWRTYHILRRRYTEQIPQRVVASDLNLSTRQLQREEKDARQALVHYLWNTYQVADKLDDMNITKAPSPNPDTLKAPTRIEELEWLQETVLDQMTDVTDLIYEVLRMLEPVFAASGIQLITQLEDNLPHLPLRAPLLRQALLNLMGMLIQAEPESDIHVHSHVTAQHIEIRVQATITREIPASFDHDMTHQLVELCQGTLRLIEKPQLPSLLEIYIQLTINKPFTVLVIDDNADTQQLFQRYLTGSRYTYVGATTFEEGLTVINDTLPHLIVLDVMMPHQDGWTLLGQLRYQPQTSQIPIIICTILPQQDLAMALGADDFIRKPVSRSAFLSVLNRQADLLAKDSD